MYLLPLLALLIRCSTHSTVQDSLPLLPQWPFSSLPYVLPQEVEAHTCNPRPQEADTAEPWVWGQPGLYMEILCFLKTVNAFSFSLFSLCCYPLAVPTNPLSSELDNDQISEQEIENMKHIGTKAYTHAHTPARASPSARHTCCRSTQEKEAGGHSSDFKVNLSYTVRYYFKK